MKGLVTLGKMGNNDECIMSLYILVKGAKKKEKKKKVVALLSTSHKVAVSHLVVEEELSLLCMVFCLLLN